MITAISNKEMLLRNKIVELALMQHYKFYDHGKHGPDTFDCAGFVWYIYHEILGIDIYQDGIGLSTTTKIMTSQFGNINYFEDGNINKDLSIVNRGDILLFHRQSLDEFEPKKNNKYPGHCGICIGDNRFIHASSTKGHIAINSFEKSEYWVKKLVASIDIISNINEKN